MDADEIRTLLGDNIFERAKKYRKRIPQSTCTVNADGVRHISAMVQGSGGSFQLRAFAVCVRGIDAFQRLLLSLIHI